MSTRLNENCRLQSRRWRSGSALLDIERSTTDAQLFNLGSVSPKLWFADSTSCHDRARDVTEVIVSFSPSDEKRVRPIIEGLQRAGHDVWYDSSADRQITDRIRNTDCVVVVC